MRIGVLLFVAALLTPPGRAQVPVYAVSHEISAIRFKVKASVPIAGKFDKWNATLTFASREVSSGALNITIQAASVDTGSGIKNSKLKSKDFFYVEHNPLITFRSTAIRKTGPDTYEVPGTFTIRGVSNPETLKLTVSNVGAGSAAIVAAMAFNRRGYEMHGSIPFIKIADLVEVDIDLKLKHLSGPPVFLK